MAAESLYENCRSQPASSAPPPTPTFRNFSSLQCCVIFRSMLSALSHNLKFSPGRLTCPQGPCITIVPCCFDKMPDKATYGRKDWWGSISRYSDRRLRELVTLHPELGSGGRRLPFHIYIYISHIFHIYIYISHIYFTYMLHFIYTHTS